MIENYVPNIGLKTAHHIRRGRSCVVPKISPKATLKIKNLKEASFSVMGPRLFNSMPARIRNMNKCSTECFKRNLDNYLTTVPDEPQIQGYTSQRRAESNSLLDMIALVNTSQDGGDSTMSTTRGGHPWSP